MAKRSDREKGNRGAFEAARLKILKTQKICGICGKPVDFSYKNPHPLAPTVDHIIPVAKGGHPSDISNLQLAHRCCNRQKADKLLDVRQINEDKQAAAGGVSKRPDHPGRGQADRVAGSQEESCIHLGNGSSGNQ